MTTATTMMMTRVTDGWENGQNDDDDNDGDNHDDDDNDGLNLEVTDGGGRRCGATSTCGNAEASKKV